MAKDIDLEIKSIIGEISEVNSRNEQKIIAVASWNGRPDTIDIRKYNVSDDILTKGISLTPEEAAEALYILLASTEIPYDRERVREILAQQEDREVDVQKLVADLPDGALPEHIEVPDEATEQFEDVSYGNRRPYTNDIRAMSRPGVHRIIPKKNGLFNHLYK
jgi:hypothetical protein